MYTRWINFINSKKLVLASNSAFRQQCLKDLNFIFNVQISGFAEDLEKTNSYDYVNKTVYGKFDSFMKLYPKYECDIVIFADTIVELDGKIIEKPVDEEEVYKFFKAYSNNCVSILTSIIVAIVNKDNSGDNIVKQFKQDTAISKVYFQEINDDIIKDYIQYENKNNIFRASGGFSNTGLTKTLIKNIDGCFYNCDGFPIQLFIKVLLDMLVSEYGPNAWNI